MEILPFIFVYLGCTVAFIFVLLFGENLMFQGTPVSWIHWCLTQGIWDGLRILVMRCCGEGGIRGFASMSECWDRPNPILQISYVFFVLVGFALYWSSLFVLLPNPWVPAYHMDIGICGVVACLTIFVMACRSDPGTVTPGNLSQHQAMYPCDGKVWPEKMCRTCHFQRPSRSKHCNTCGKCIARHDHHCGWINNCVGLGNLRLFLLFLVSHVVLCVYGSLLACAILGGELKRHGLLEHRFMNWRTGQQEYLRDHPARLFEWTMVYYPVAIAVAIFLVLSSLLLSFFIGYHLYLISQGKTQYEAYRWMDLHKHLMAQEMERMIVTPPTAAAAGCDKTTSVSESEKLSEDSAQEGSLGSSSVKSKASGKGFLSLFTLPRRIKVTLPPNPYNHGFVRNLCEVLWWEWHLQRASEQRRSQ